MNIFRKAINFDLDTKAAERCHPRKTRREAYRDIERFLKSHGFDHRQKSGYVSVNPMINTEVYELVEVMDKTFPWLHACLNVFDVTDVGKQYDMLPFFGSSSLVLQKSSSIETPKKAFEPQNLSILIDNAEKTKAKKQSTQIQHVKDKEIEWNA